MPLVPDQRPNQTYISCAGLAFLVLPGGRDGTVVGVSVLELDLGDLGLFENGGSLLFCVAEQDLVCLRTNLEYLLRLRDRRQWKEWNYLHQISQ